MCNDYYEKTCVLSSGCGKRCVVQLAICTCNLKFEFTSYQYIVMNLKTFKKLSLFSNI